MSFVMCSEISNFFLKTNFLDRSKIKYPSSELDSFIFEVFYDQSNSAEVSSKSAPHVEQLCTHLRISGISRNALRDAAHVASPTDLVAVYQDSSSDLKKKVPVA